jgi:hypothetical protein
LHWCRVQVKPCAAAELRKLYILIGSAMKLAKYRDTGVPGLMAATYFGVMEMPRTQVEALLQWDAWADVLTKHIGHRNALHDAATAQATAKRWRGH